MLHIRNFLDLAVIYQVLLEVSFYGTASMLISDEHLKMWNVKEAEIFARATRNSQENSAGRLSAIK